MAAVVLRLSKAAAPLTSLRTRRLHVLVSNLAWCLQIVEVLRGIHAVA